jgi:hypothetical protein
MRLTGLLVGISMAAAPAVVAAHDAAPSAERGRLLVQTSGCNDCHTEGYGLKEGDIPESEWLKGSILGWRGPWGTTYAINLRLKLHEMNEEEWAKYSASFKTRPPMPWFNVHAMDESDRRSLYLYVTSFKELGEPAPQYVPPDQEPKGPFIQFPAPPPQ